MDRLRPVLIGGKVYVGGGRTGNQFCAMLVFHYDPERDGWDHLPHCPVKLFTLGQFQGHLITVGGLTAQGDPTGNVYRYREESREWEEYLKPMPTARSNVAVISTQAAIVACGGVEDRPITATVEVYTAETAQWHASDPLPKPYTDMTSVTIGDTCYLLGGVEGDEHRFSASATVLRAPVSSLIQKAVSPSEHSVWETIPDLPLHFSSAASLDGHLLAIGDVSVHMFFCDTNSWVRMPAGDLPTEIYEAAAIELPDNKLLVCGGCNSTAERQRYRNHLKSVYIGLAIH